MPRNPIDYKNTIFYKIVCRDLEVKDCYVGHTTNFKRRKTEHKSRCNNEKGKHYHFKVYQYIRENGGWDNWDMIEIERKECIDCLDAKKTERYWIEALKANLNGTIPNRTNLEYYQDNKEKIKKKSNNYYKQNKEKKIEYSKNYYEQNRERLLEKNKEKFTCECGLSLTIINKKRHFKTKKHQDYLASLE